MTIEIILVVIGVIFLIGSCLVQEKLSEKDVDQIARLGEEEIKIILQKKINSATEQIEAALSSVITEVHEDTKREMERTSNEKIMEISEYSDTILDAMNKTHNEIMFLYSMLNDKQADINEIVTSIQKISKQIKEEAPVPKRTIPQVAATSNAVVNTGQEKINRAPEHPRRGIKLPTAGNPVIPTEVLQNDFVEQAPTKKVEPVEIPDNSNGNQNIRILQLHRAGKSDVAIAKELNCGLGEVRLVLGLYKGDSGSEN